MLKEAHNLEQETSDKVYQVLVSFFTEGITATTFPHSILTIQHIIGNVVKSSLLCTQLDFVASKQPAAKSASIHESVETIQKQLIQYFTNEPLKRTWLGTVATADNKSTQKLLSLLKERPTGYGLPQPIFNRLDSLLTKNDYDDSSVVTPKQIIYEQPVSSFNPDEGKSEPTESANVATFPLSDFILGLSKTTDDFPSEVAGYFAKMSEMGRIKIETENEVVLLDPAEVWKLYEIFRVQYPDLDDKVNPFAIWSFMSENIMKPTYNYHEKRNELGMSYKEEFILLIMMTLIENKVPVADTASK